MRPFNLLPESILRQQRRRRMLIRLSIAQVLILTAVIISFPVLRLISATVTLRSEELTKLISDSRYTETDQLVESIMETKNTLTVRDSVVSSYSLDFFNREWLDYANNTIPVGVELTGFEFFEGYLSLYCQTEDLSLVEKQRRNLEDTGRTATLGTIALNGGVYLYTVKLSVVE